MGRTSDAKERLMSAVQELIWRGSYGTTTIDQICEKSGVKKGSFYHFFESKCDLAAAALDDMWQQKRRPEMDAIFSPTVPPLERLRNFCEEGYRNQVEAKAQCGSVLGCPLFTLGAEVCNCDAKLHTKIKEILNQYHKYIESAIRDAHAQGAIHAPDAAAKARMVFAYGEGLLTQARILNDVDVLKEMVGGVMGMLGVKDDVKQAA